MAWPNFKEEKSSRITGLGRQDSRYHGGQQQLRDKSKYLILGGLNACYLIQS